MAIVSDVVVPAWDELSVGVLISEPRVVYAYEDNKKTDKLLGYKGTFLIPEGKGTGLQIDVKLGVAEAPDWKLMQPYEFVYDKDKSKVYVQGRNLALSLWAKSVELMS